MTPEHLIDGIRAEIIDHNLELYRQMFPKPVAKGAIPYWRRAKELYGSLTDEQREVLFQIMRQVMVDTTATLLALLDGASYLKGQKEDFKLTTETGTERLNEDLHNLFLEKEETDPR